MSKKMEVVPCVVVHGEIPEPLLRKEQRHFAKSLGVTLYVVVHSSERVVYIVPSMAVDRGVLENLAHIVRASYAQYVTKVHVGVTDHTEYFLGEFVSLCHKKAA